MHFDLINLTFESYIGVSRIINSALMSQYLSDMKIRER